MGWQCPLNRGIIDILIVNIFELNHPNYGKIKMCEIGVCIQDIYKTPSSYFIIVEITLLYWNLLLLSTTWWKLMSRCFCWNEWSIDLNVHGMTWKWGHVMQIIDELRGWYLFHPQHLLQFTGGIPLSNSLSMQWRLQQYVWADRNQWGPGIKIVSYR